MRRLRSAVSSLRPYTHYQPYPRFGWRWRHKPYRATWDVGVIVFGLWLGVRFDYGMND